MKVIFSALAILALVAGSSTNAKAQAPLPSWNDGPAKQAIVDFVRTTTEKGGAKFVPPEERIATFDQDGTLWVEHPVYSRAVSSETAPRSAGYAQTDPYPNVGGLTGCRPSFSGAIFSVC